MFVLSFRRSVDHDGTKANHSAMRFQSLVHVASVAAVPSPGRRIVVPGYSSLLSSFPALGYITGPL